VHLRQAYAALRGDAGQLAEIIVASAGGFFTMLRATLRLNGVEPPSAPDTLVRAAGGAAGFRAADLDPLVQHVMGVRPLQLRAGDPLPAAYLAAVAATAAYVHRLERKGS
jgi:hypothetical protein